MSQYKSLFTGVQVGAVNLRNRITTSALTRSRCMPTNVPNTVNVEYYRQCAEGGAGLIVTEGALIAQQGTEWQHAPGIWNAEQIAGWKKVTDAVHVYGGTIFVQLWHVGRVAHPDAPEQIAAGTPVYGPSAIAARGGKFRFLPGVPGYVTPVAIEDPWKFVELYKKAAVNAKDAGFDGIEIHASGGYLPNAFLDSTSNKRTDEWGGTVENRARFGLEVLKAVNEVFGADRVGIKLQPCGGFNDMGMPLDEALETYRYFIQQADALEIAYIVLMRYSERFDRTFDGVGRATKHDVLASYRPFVKNAKVIFNGDLTVDEADSLIASGQIDAAAFGLYFIANPDLVKKLERGVELNEADLESVYGRDHVTLEEAAKGYTDYKLVTDVNA